MPDALARLSYGMNLAHGRVAGEERHGGGRHDDVDRPRFASFGEERGGEHTSPRKLVWMTREDDKTYSTCSTPKTLPAVSPPTRPASSALSPLSASPGASFSRDVAA